MTKTELIQLIKEVIDEPTLIQIIISKLRRSQDDVRGVNVSETKYFESGKDAWTKKYDK